MFTSDLKETHDRELTLKDIDPAVLEFLLQFYSGAIGITEANVQSLVAAFNVLEVLSMRDARSMFMARHASSREHLQLLGVGIQSFAETMSCERLQETAKEYALVSRTWCS